MANVVILGAGMMGTAISMPLADNGHRVHLVGTHLDTDIIEEIHQNRYHPKLRTHVADNVYPFTYLGLDKAMQKKNDVFLEKRLESLIFSFKTNKRVFKGLLLLSRLPNYRPVSNFIDHRFPYAITVSDIYNFQQQSLERMVELFNNGRDAQVLDEHPMGKYHRQAS